MRLMRGSLSETSVADLCRGLSHAGSTGTVEIDHPSGAGAIVFRKGRIVIAGSPAPRARLGDRLVNAALLTPEQLEETLELQRSDPSRPKLGALLVERGLVTRDAIRVFVQEQILDALFEVFPWSEGTFEFDATPLIDEEERLPVELTVDQMLVEVARRHSEWDQIRGVISGLDAVPTFATGGSTANASLEPDEFAVLASVDGSRTVRELAEDLGYSEFEAARIVYGLVLLGVIGIEGAEPPVRVAQASPQEPDLAPEPPPDPGPEAAAELQPEIDVAAALEEAIARTQEADGPDDEAAGQPPATRPTVRISRGPGAFPWNEHETSEPSEPAEPAPVDLDDDWTTAFDAPEPILSDRPAVVERGDEPEPWVFDSEPSPGQPASPEEPAAAAASTPGPESEPVQADDEFGALIDELTEGAPGAVLEEEPPASVTPAPPAEPDSDPSRRSEDVSEFLRELSRLALDEGAQPASPEDVPTDAEDTRPPGRRPPQSEQSQQSDDSRKRGLFGWGR
jgi:hypothetical protein